MTRQSRGVPGTELLLPGKDQGHHSLSDFTSAGQQRDDAVGVVENNSVCWRANPRKDYGRIF